MRQEMALRWAMDLNLTRALQVPRPTGTHHDSNVVHLRLRPVK